MSVSLPPLSRLDPPQGARYSPNSASNPTSDSPLIRLPSYQEFTSQCASDSPQNASRPSSLFTAGLIHLPPLKLPTACSSEQALSPTHSQPRYKDLELDISAHPHREDYWKPHGTAFATQPRFLDLAQHDPAPRMPSPYTDASTDSEGSGSAMTPEWPLRLPPPYDPAYDTYHEQHQHHHEYCLPHATYPPPASLNMHLHQPHAHASGLSLDTFGLSLDASRLSLEVAHAHPANGKLKFSHAKAGGRPKKQALSCFFCRERKIACGRPEPGVQPMRAPQDPVHVSDCVAPRAALAAQERRAQGAGRRWGRVGILIAVSRAPTSRVSRAAVHTHTAYTFRP